MSIFNNTGNRNVGNRNVGNGNTGNGNTGNWNAGNRNTGDWNVGNENTGYLNTTTPDTIRIFNKEVKVDRNNIRFPDYFSFFNITEWIYEEDMTAKEKEDNPTYKTTGGYLKSLGYKEAWRISWDKASDEDRRKTLDIPGWDNEVFKEISGIDVEKELNQRCSCECDKGKFKFCPNCGVKLT